ncbi:MULTISPECIES: glutamate mutase L [unclassified Streptomyces]|uniref:glutamate mutase L n=1 Tax=unclassified Streptomyces TaxID=2593676 RepID=UPI003369C0CD
MGSIEIGSTYTKMVVYHVRANRLEFVARFSDRTTADEGDIGIGVDRLLARAAEQGLGRLDRTYVSSSAAGGLRIAVCGLTRSLSMKIGVEVALGAGGVVVHSSAGRLRPADVAGIRRARPGLVLVCGGTDHGEADAVLHNVRAVAAARLDTAVVYAGNGAVQDEVRDLLARYDVRCAVSENVYPDHDCFRFDEVRAIVRRAYEQDVVKAPGVDELCRRLDVGCVPTPYAVSRAATLLGEVTGGLVVLDVGGATTDVHSCRPATAGEVLQASFEPAIKRTVEGDLGVFHNLRNLLADGETVLDTQKPLTDPDRLGEFAVRAARTALERHCGRILPSYATVTAKNVVSGPDLSAVKTVVVTGGALRYGLRDPQGLIAGIKTLPPHLLAPRDLDQCLVDRNYLLSSLGSLCEDHEDGVREFMKNHWREGMWM